MQTTTVDAKREGRRALRHLLAWLPACSLVLGNSACTQPFWDDRCGVESRTIVVSARFAETEDPEAGYVHPWDQSFPFGQASSRVASGCRNRSADRLSESANGPMEHISRDSRPLRSRHGDRGVRAVAGDDDIGRRFSHHLER